MSGVQRALQPAGLATTAGDAQSAFTARGWLSLQPRGGGAQRAFTTSSQNLKWQSVALPSSLLSQELDFGAAGRAPPECQRIRPAARKG